MQRYLAAAAKGRRKERERIGSTKESCGLMSFKKKPNAKIPMLEAANFLFSVEVTGSST
jgi:hypothetical protein